jgi:hypothetical protein
MHQLSRVHRFGATQIAELVARAYLSCSGRDGWLTRKDHPVSSLAEERQLSEVTRIVGEYVRKSRAEVRRDERKPEPRAPEQIAAEHVAGAAHAARLFLDQVRPRAAAGGAP